MDFNPQNNRLPAGKNLLIISNLIFAFTSLSLFAQENIEVAAKKKYHANLLYNELYRNHTPMSFLVPFGELFAPSKYILSSEIVPNFFVLANYKSRISVALTPLVKIRIRSNSNPGDSSSPVRTPSYEISAKTFLRYNLLFQKTEDTIQFKYWMISYTHHSNGQDGNALNPDGTWNTYNGNFSTNYLKIGFNWGKRNQTYKNNGFSYKLSGYGSIETKFKSKEYKNLYQVEYEWHPSFTFPSLVDYTLLEHEEKLDGHFGFSRLHFKFTHFITGRYNIVESIEEKKKKKAGIPSNTIGNLIRDIWRIEFKASYILNKLESYDYLQLKKRLNIEGAVHWTPRFMNQTALYASLGYIGEDSYNIYFNDKYFFVRIGISTGFLIYNTNLNR